MIIPVSVNRNIARLMEMLLFALFTSGLMIFQPVQGQGQKERCSYAGVVHLEGNGQYTLNFQQALNVCQSLHYSLATKEQVREAYNKGLKTCRYGWIDGQNIAFVPHLGDPSCQPGEILSHEKAEDFLSDVYCFTPSELNCEDSASYTSHKPVTNQPISESVTTTTKPDPNKDIFEEAKADGFIVDNIETTLPVKHNKSPYTTQAVTTRNSGNSEKNPKIPATFITKQMTTMSTMKTNKNSVTKTNFPDTEVTKISTIIELTSTEIQNEMERMTEEGSGMNVPAFQEEGNNGLLTPTTFNSPEEDLQPSTLIAWIPELEEGSGMYPDGIPISDKLTTKSTTTVEEATSVYIQHSIVGSVNEELHQDPIGSHPLFRNSVDDLDFDVEPTTSAQAEESTPAWLVIFAFCLTLGAILCVLAGIATKDMWYGPSKKSVNTTPQENSEEYGKAATLPLSEKEQELITLMSTEKQQKNDKDFTAISLEEPPEKEYLM